MSEDIIEEAYELKKKGDRYFEEGKYSDALNFYDRSRSICETENALVGLAEIEVAKGKLYLAIENHKPALAAYNSAIKIMKRLNNLSSLGMLYLNKGIILSKLAQHKEALEWINRARTIYKSENRELFLAKANENEAAVYINLDQDKLALPLLSSAKKVYLRKKRYSDVASVEMNKGRIHSKRGKHKLALKIYNNIEKIIEEENDFQTLIKIFQRKANTYELLGDYTEAIKHLEKARSIYQNLTMEIDVARIDVSIGNILVKRSDYNKAYEIFLKSRNLFSKNGILSWVNKIDLAIADLYLDTGNFGKALKSLKLLRSKLRLPEDEHDLLHIDLMIAYSYQMIGYNEKSLRLYNKLKKIFNDKKNELIVAKINNNIASILQNYQKFEEALRLCYKAREVFKKYNQMPQLGSISRHIAGLLCSLNHFTEALERCREAKAIFKKKNMAVNFAISQMEEARILAALNKKDQALRLLETAQHELRNTPVQLAQVYVEKAIILEKQDPLKALQAWNNAKNLYKKCNMKFDLAATDVNLAWIYYNLGRNEDALKSLNQTIESHSELLHISWEVHALKGLIYKSLEENIAIGSFKKSVEILERIRGETFLRNFFLEDKLFVYGEIIKHYIDKNMISEALKYSERARCRTVVDLLGNTNKMSTDHTIKKFEEAESNARKKIHKFFIQTLMDQENLNRIYSSCEKENLRQIKKVKASLRESKKGLISCKNELLKIDDQKRNLYYNNRSLQFNTVPTIDLKQIKEHIFSTADSDNILIVEFYVTKNILYAFLIRKKGKPQVKSIDITEKELFNIVESLDLEFNAPVNSAQKCYRIPRNFFSFSEKIVELIFDHASRGDLIILIPHLLISYVPFSALCYKAEKKKRKYIKFLIEDYSLLSVPSLTVLGLCKQKTNRNMDKALVMGNPQPPGNLLFGEREAKIVAKQFRTKPYLKKSATKGRIEKEAKNYDVLHFACHGSFEKANLSTSGILMSNFKMLDINDILNLNLEANLITLTACKSARQTLSRGDEWLSVVRAFLAGSSSVIASLWEVEDKSTMEIISDFYQNWKSDNTINKAKALQMAQTNFINKARKNAEEAKEGYYTLNFRGSESIKIHPYFWAGLQLYGDWE